MRVALTIAGLDPSGGAGLAADLKTFHRFGVYGEAVATLVTVQNTEGVTRVEVLPAELVTAQIHALLSDIPPHAAKTGALGSHQVVQAIAGTAADFRFPLVVDPVMFSKHGAALLSEDARSAVVSLLIPASFLVTPNLAEAEALAGIPVHDQQSMLQAAREIIGLGARNVLVKGGHLADDALDLLVTESGEVHEFTAARIASRHTHGSGCTYAAAITAELAKETGLIEAVGRAKKFVTNAIRSAPGIGRGQGPLNHWA